MILSTNDVRKKLLFHKLWNTLNKIIIMLRLER